MRLLWYDRQEIFGEGGVTAATLRVDAFLCDGVEGVGGKLYALGIGWNTLFVAGFPARHPRLGVGLVMHVPYTATNQQHRFFVHLESEDGVPLALADASEGVANELVESGKVVRLGGQVNVGRPPDLAPGDEQVVALAMQIDGVEFATAGLYAAVVTVDGSEEARMPFRLRQIQQVMTPGLQR
jgi:hypothetical protein